MPSNYQRIDRISEEFRREIDRIIRDELHDPRIAGTWSITRAEVARDLRTAKVYVSVLEDDRRAPLLAALKNAGGYLKRALSRQMIIRQVPEITFVEDHNIEYGVHIAQGLTTVSLGQPEEDSAEANDAEA